MNALNPWFLAGLAAVAVPILIHLLQRQRIRRVVFPATRFLLGASRLITSRHLLREKLLLAARVGVIALAAIACARPFFARPAQAAALAAGTPGVAIVLQVDGSASMSVGSRMADARGQALAVLDACRPGIDRVGLVLTGAEPAVRVPIGDDLQRVRAALRDLHPAWSAGDIAGDLQTSDRLLRDDAGGAMVKRVVLISDLQRSGFAHAADGWKLSPGVELVVKPVAKGEADNVAILKATVPQGAVVSPRPRPISAQIANLGAVAHQGVRVTLSIGGTVVAEKTVNLPAGATEVVRFERAFDQPGDFAGEIRAAAGDDFPDDDVWFFAVPVRPRIEVLVIDGTFGAAGPADDARFVREAFAVPDSPYHAREVAPAAMTEKDLGGVQAVVACDVCELPAPARAALERFVTSGGGLIAFCGGHVDPARFNVCFAGLAPCSLKAPVDAGEGGSAIGEVDLSHPIFALFGAPQSGDFAAARFRRSFQVGDSQTSRVLARFIDGRPALIEATVGAGTSLLFTSSAGLGWNDFCLQGGIYVPFLHEAVRWCSVRTTAPVNLEVGATLAAAGATAVRPDGSKAATLVAEVPGIHRVSAAGSAWQVAVNLPRSESSVALRDAAEIGVALTAEAVGKEERRDGEVWRVAVAGSARERFEGAQRIGFVLLIAVLGLMLAEHLIANATVRA